MLLSAMNIQGLSMNVIDLNSVRDAKHSADPYDFILGASFLQANALDDLRRDFPNIVKPGYLTVDEVDLHGRFKTLIDELEGPELTEELSRKFGQDLHRFPRLTTIMKRSQPKYGAIHTDGPSKVMTMLVYMNDDWQQDAGGRLRVLYNKKNFEPMLGGSSEHGHHVRLPALGQVMARPQAFYRRAAGCAGRLGEEPGGCGAQEEAQQAGPGLQGHLQTVRRREVGTGSGSPSLGRTGT